MRNIILTALIVLAAVFAMQNMHPVELVFIVWSIQTVVALAIIVSLALGMLIGALLVLPAVMRNKRRVKQSVRHATELENSLKEQQSASKARDDFSGTP
ncbi:hypothetical protein GALL_188840 [mine drainage metagenome]|uniref:Lipopolysaccharide assembly protein A domain-containing protein n=1 Tax=mine drainage metagenome TaxID=410659 RepID=A0A1J5RTX9_9ZZZZ